MRSFVSLSRNIAALALCLLSAQPLCAQTPAPAVSDAVPTHEAVAGWAPLGMIPVDQAGAGRRGYVLPGESADVAAPGAVHLSFHTVAANNFFREETADFLITQRFEAHTAAVGYRRGFKAGILPRIELGGQIQFNQSGHGVLNGFITGVEDLWVSLTGRVASKVDLRTNPATRLPLGTVVTRDGRPIYRTAGDDHVIGDMYLVAKALVRDRAPASGATRVAVRAALNVSGSHAFTQGNFAGAGLSAERKLTEWVAVHGDVRVNLFLDRVSPWGLPLRRASLAFSAGPEFRIARNTSVGVQVNGSGTPYLPTGTVAFDEGYGDVTLGLSQRFGLGGPRVLLQVYARENMTLPFRIRMNTDPDLSIGVKLGILN